MSISCIFDTTPIITYIVTLLRSMPAVGLVRRLGRMAVTVRVGLLRRRLLLVRLLVVGLARIAAIRWLLLMIHLSVIKSLSDYRVCSQ